MVLLAFSLSLNAGSYIQRRQRDPSAAKEEHSFRWDDARDAELHWEDSLLSWWGNLSLPPGSSTEPFPSCPFFSCLLGLYALGLRWKKSPPSKRKNDNTSPQMGWSRQLQIVKKVTVWHNLPLISVLLRGDGGDRGTKFLGPGGSAGGPGSWARLWAIRVHK